MKEDPLVALLAAALSGLLERGLDVTPRDGGWLIKLADPDTDSQREAVRSSW